MELQANVLVIVMMAPQSTELFGYYYFYSENNQPNTLHVLFLSMKALCPLSHGQYDSDTTDTLLSRVLLFPAYENLKISDF